VQSNNSSTPASKVPPNALQNQTTLFKTKEIKVYRCAIEKARQVDDGRNASGRGICKYIQEKDIVARNVSMFMHTSRKVCLLFQCGTIRVACEDPSWSMFRRRVGMRFQSRQSFLLLSITNSSETGMVGFSSTRSSGQPRRPFRTQCLLRCGVAHVLRAQSSKTDVRSRCAFVV
jgi:hypothetical protein